MGVWVGELWEALGVPVSQLEYVQRRHDSGSFAGFLIESVKSLVGICPFDTFHLEHRKLNFELLINPRSCNHDLLLWMGQKKKKSFCQLSAGLEKLSTHSCALALGSELHHLQRGMGAAGKVTLFNTFNLFFFLLYLCPRNFPLPDFHKGFLLSVSGCQNWCNLGGRQWKTPIPPQARRNIVGCFSQNIITLSSIKGYSKYFRRVRNWVETNLYKIVLLKYV